jgi:hypothetical protein
MTVNQVETLQTVLDECFWGDYAITLEEAQKRLSGEDLEFERFLFQRIIAESPFPSNRLRVLFTEEKLRTLFATVPLRGRAAQRGSLARAVIMNETWEKEPEWIRVHHR